MFVLCLRALTAAAAAAALYHLASLLMTHSQCDARLTFNFSPTRQCPLASRNLYLGESHHHHLYHDYYYCCYYYSYCGLLLLKCNDSTDAIAKRLRGHFAHTGW